MCIRDRIDDFQVRRIERQRQVHRPARGRDIGREPLVVLDVCLLYTSDAADERSSVDLGGRRTIKKTKKKKRELVAHHV